jgi:hypothetical protein
MLLLVEQLLQAVADGFQRGGDGFGRGGEQFAQDQPDQMFLPLREAVAELVAGRVETSS